MRKIIGIGMVVIGLVWLILPFMPGILLIAIGVELLGFNMLLLDRIEKRLAILQRFRRKITM